MANGRPCSRQRCTSSRRAAPAVGRDEAETLAGGQGQPFGPAQHRAQPLAQRHLAGGEVQAPAADAGQPAGHAQLVLAAAQRFLGTLALADVGDDDETAAHRAGGVAVGHQGDDRIARPRQRRQRDVESAGLAVHRQGHLRADHLLHLGRVEFAPTAALQVGVAAAEPLLAGEVGEQVAAFAVEPGHRAGQRRRQLGELRLAVAQGLLGLHALAEVQMGADHPPRLPFAVAFDDAAAVEHPDPVALAVTQAVDGLVGRRAAVDVRLLRRQHVGRGRRGGSATPSARRWPRGRPRYSPASCASAR